MENGSLVGRDQPSRAYWNYAPSYRPPSDFRLNVEAGLRTALSLGLAFLWMGFGPFEGDFSFFAGVTAIVCVGNSAGHTISRSLLITHGVLIGIICGILPCWMMQWGALPAGAGFFVAILLVTRSRRLTILGKKFGCLGVVILALGEISEEGLTISWLRFAFSFLRATIEGGIAALVASLLPYPRFATREGALRAQDGELLSRNSPVLETSELRGIDVMATVSTVGNNENPAGADRVTASFMCRSLSLAVDACVTGFIKARDETSISRARLLCLQVRHNLGVMRMELEWSRLEMGLLCGGFLAGGMQLADSLEELSKVIEEVLQGVRGMRQSVLNMHRTRAQASFTRAIGSALRDVSAAVDETLEATSRRSVVLPEPVFVCGKRGRAVPAASGEGIGNAEHEISKFWRNPNSSSKSKSTSREAPTTFDAGGGMSTGTTNTAEEENALNTLPTSRHLSLRQTRNRLANTLARLTNDYQRARKEVLYGLDELGRPLQANTGEGGAGDERSSPLGKPNSLEPLQHRAKLDWSPADGVDTTEHLLSRRARSTANTSDEQLEAEGGSGGRRGQTGNPAADTPNHVLVMKERQKLGSSATMARGAFLFSLFGLCKALRKERAIRKMDWRPSHTVEAASFVFSGLWKAIRPPPGLLTAIASSARWAADWCCCWYSCLCGGDHSLRREQRRRGVVTLLEGLCPLLGRGRRGQPNGRRNSKRWAVVTKNRYFWCFKVALALTLCAVFSLSPFLAEQFDPPIWIAVTSSFIMDNQSASAISTSSLRLLGTVLGAVYGVLAANFSNQPEDEPFGFQSHAILLPWVAVTSFFRNSSQFSYAALVAGFTAVVIFTGSNTVLGVDGEAVSLARIVNTVVGSVIYLLVDLLLVPTRAKELLVEQVHVSLEAAFNELSINGERMFGPIVCPRNSRTLFLRSLNRSRSLSRGGSADHPSPPFTPVPVGGNVPPRATDEEVRGRGEVRDDIKTAAEAGAMSWGQLPAAGEVLLPGFSSEKPGFLGDTSTFPNPEVEIQQGSRSSSGREHQTECVLPSGSTASAHPSSPEDAHVRDEGGAVRDGLERGVTGQGDTMVDGSRECCGGKVGCISDRGGNGRSEGGSAAVGDAETGPASCTRGTRERESELRGAALVSREAADTAWGGHAKESDCIRRMVTALALQKRYLPLAELEPQLWYEPFPASAYQAMVAAQEELLRALTLLTKAAIAVSEDRSTKWRQELSELGSHLSSLVKLLKISLEDARDVFSNGRVQKGLFSHFYDCESGGWDERDDCVDGSTTGAGRQGMRMLDVQADATRLNADVQSDYVMFIQVFIDRGEFPVWELESVLRLSTAVISVMGVEKALLTLGHAVATVIDRETHGAYYQ